jgi:hypothetical protein
MSRRGGRASEIMSQKTKFDPAIEIYVRVNFQNGSMPPTFLARYPIGEESDIAKIVRHGLAMFQEEKIPAKRTEHLHD